MFVLAQQGEGFLGITANDVGRVLMDIAAFVAILVVGFIVAKIAAKLLNTVLERVGFDKAVERGGVRRAMARTRYDASDLLGKVVQYAIMLFALTLAFQVFGPNPVTALLAGVIAYLPRIFVAIVILVVAAWVASAVKDVVLGSIGGLSYGPLLANAAAVVIVTVGIFAALNQLQIAPAIVNGLFYALLAVVVGSAIVAIGGGGIQPMRRQWERALSRVEDESSRMREQAEQSRHERGVGDQRQGAQTVRLDEGTEVHSEMDRMRAPGER